LKVVEILVNYYYTYILIIDKVETKYIYRTKNYNIKLIPSIIVTKLAPKLVYYRFNYYNLSYLS